MNLKSIRKSKRLTQEEVSKAINIGRVNYNRYELGQVQPSIDTLIKLADFYKVTVDELIGHEVPYLINKSLLSDKQKDILNLLLELNDLQCEKVESYILGMKSK